MMNWENFESQNLYDVLGVHPSVSAADIRSRYRQAALRAHPDKGGSPEAFHHLAFAFEVLSCPVSRAVYDKNYRQSTRRHHYGVSRVRTARTTNASSAGASFRSKRVSASMAMRTPPRRPTTAQSKRSAPPHAWEPRKKCQRANLRSKTDAALLQERMAELRDVLRYMKADQREVSLKMLTPRVQTALMIFMQTAQTHPKAPTETFQNNPAIASKPVSLASRTQSLLKPSDVSRIITGSKGAFNDAPTKYVAHMHVKALRIYTRGHTELEVALERQMVLVQLRQALSVAGAKDPTLWEDASRLYELCSEVLEKNSTSEEKLGMSTYVYLRAGHLLLQNCTIIAPVMPLAEALALHCRLLHARRTSWQELRAEWVQLMHCDRYPASKRKSLREAEAFADDARANALKMQLARATMKAAKALAIEDRRISRQRRAEMRQRAHELKMALQTKNAAAAVKRKAAREQREEWRARKRWWSRPDLTIDEIMHGAHPRATAGGS